MSPPQFKLEQKSKFSKFAHLQASPNQSSSFKLDKHKLLNLPEIKQETTSNFYSESRRTLEQLSISDPQTPDSQSRIVSNSEIQEADLEWIREDASFKRLGI